MVDRIFKEVPETARLCSRDDQHVACQLKSQRSSLALHSFSSEQSLTSTDPGEESCRSQYLRSFSDLSWADALQASSLNKRLEAVLEELERTLTPVDLRQLRKKTCGVCLNASQCSLRVRRSAGLR